MTLYGPAARLWFEDHGRPVEDRLLEQIKHDPLGAGPRVMRGLRAAEAVSTRGTRGMEALLIRPTMAETSRRLLERAAPPTTEPAAPSRVVDLMMEAEVDITRVFLAVPEEADRMVDRLDAAIEMHALADAIDRGEDIVPDTIPENRTP